MTAAITDFSQFASLRVAADNNDPEVLREVAGQFEALFIQTMLKNMREASLGDPLLGDSNQHEMYESMLDQQLSLEMSSGRGLGLADMLVRQLGGEDAAARVAPTTGHRLPESSPVAGSGFSLTESIPAKTYRLPKSSPVGSMVPLPTWHDAKSFAIDVWPHAERAAARLDVAPEAIVAQAALETGWGAHVPQRGDGSSSYNLFGIKAGRGWSGESVSKPTLEFVGGAARPEVAEFRAYDDVSANFDDYSDMLTANPRYESVGGHGDDIAGFAKALQTAGYATDPAYAEKLKAVADSETMQDAIAGLKSSGPQPITLRQPSDGI